MTEHVPQENYPHIPIADGIPLAYLETEEQGGIDRRIYVMDTPEFRDRYVVRPMDFHYSRSGAIFSPREQLTIYNNEYSRLRQAGVAVPNVRTGIPDDYHETGSAAVRGRDADDIMLVVDRIKPVDPTTVDPEHIKTQARGYITGLVTYFADSFSQDRRDPPQLQLSDPYRDRQVVYGTPPGSDKPDFYMVDVGAEFEDALSFFNIPHHRGEMLATAQRLGYLTNDAGMDQFVNGQLAARGYIHS